MANYTNLNSLLEENLGLNEFGIGQLRSVEWSRKYLWSVSFLDDDGSGGTYKAETEGREDLANENIPDAPFDKFFPAVDIDVNEIELASQSESSFIGPIEFPLESGLKTMRLTFLDDQNNTLYKFFRRWVNNRITGNRRYTLPLAESLKSIEVRKLKLTSIGEFAVGLAGEAGVFESSDEKGNGSMTEINSYWIFPRGSLTYNGSSQSETHIYSMEFIIAGELDPNAVDGGFGDSLRNIAKVFGATAITSGLGNVL